MAQNNNMYRVGDFVYFENSAAGPYQIRRIEELNKTGGNVEARVVLYHRRRDISNALLKIADQADRKFDEYYEEDSPEDSNNGDAPAQQPQHTAAGVVVANGTTAAKDGAVDGEKAESGDDNKEVKEEVAELESSDWGTAGLPTDSAKLAAPERHRLRQRELFLTRQVETLPATNIRGKCQVFLLSDVEPPEAYQGEDVFFYSLVYDSAQQSLLADKGAIKVGKKHQVAVPDFVSNEDDKKMEVDDDDDEDMKENGNLMIDEEAEENGPAVKKRKGEDGAVQVTERETLVYHPYHTLTERDIDQFLIMARAVGTFARALDQSSSTKLPSLHMTAAYASRDVTLFHAMALLHQANYDIGKAVKYLVPPANKTQYPLEVDQATNHNTISLGGPLLCRDQMEEWSAPEANLFEEAMDKYGKDFNDIHADYLPWKSMRDIIEYYYMWKASNRYADMKKKKVADRENKLKQVYIPNFNNKPTPNLVGTHNTGTTLQKGTSPCESCKCTEALNWYAWGPASQQLRLCQECWMHWKKYAGLKYKHKYDHYDMEMKEDDGQEDHKTNIVQHTNNPIAAINKQAQSVRPPQHQQIIAKLAQLNATQLQQLAQKAAAANSATSGTSALNKGKPAMSGKVSTSFGVTVWWRLMRKVVSNIVYSPSKMARKPLKEVDIQEMFNTFQNASLETKLNAARTLWPTKCTPEFQVAIKRMHDALVAGQRPTYMSQLHQNGNSSKA